MESSKTKFKAIQNKQTNASVYEKETKAQTVSLEMSTTTQAKLGNVLISIQKIELYI